jgi:hypothetical protein
MKTFSDDALAALQRGDAIVSASVEIIPATTDFVSYTIYTEDFSTGLAHFGLYQGALTGFTIVADTYGDCLQVAPGPNGIDAVVSTLSVATFSEITVKFKVTATDADDYGVMNLRDAAGDIVLTFIAGRQTSIDALRRPNVQFRDQSASPGNPIGAGAVTVGHWYEFNAVYDGSANFDVTITDLTASTTFGTATIPVTTRSTIEKLIFRTDNTAGSGTVRWDDFEIKLDVPATFADPIRLWGGYGAMALPSDAGTSTFLGIGDRGLVNQTTASIGGSAQNLTLTLSGIEPAALEVLDADEIKGASVVVRRLIFDSAGKTLLGAYVYTRGRVDELKTSEVVGGAASIELAVEGAARGLGRKGGRQRSDADQRLVSPTDGFYRAVSAAPKKTLYWGGKKPSVAGSSLGGGGSSSGSSSRAAAA